MAISFSRDLQQFRSLVGHIKNFCDLSFLQILIGIRLTTWNAVPMISRFESEKYYKDPNKNNATYPFPFLEEEGSIDLSVIVPSYNEEKRREYIIKYFSFIVYLFSCAIV